MEEDLKDLQKYISFANKSENFSHNSDWQWHKELATKIENLIARNKELEEKQCVYKNTSSCTRALSFETYAKLNNDYIPKSKVKEKMKKDEWAYKSYDSSTADYRQSQAIGRYMACLELLQEGDK